MRSRFTPVVLTFTGGSLIAATVGLAAPGDAPDVPKPKVEARAEVEAAVDAKEVQKKEARDEIKDVRDTAKDARDTAKDARGEVRDTAKDARAEVRDSRRDVRETARDARRVDADLSFRVDDYRPADIGLWFNRSTDQGLVINDVDTAGAIAKVGFREGDRIITINGHKVVREDDFMRYLFADDVRAKRVEVIVFRGGRQEVIYVQPTVFVEQLTYVENDPLEQFGIILDDRYDDRIVVWRVVPRSPAFYSGIRAGDVIVTFHGRKVVNRKDFVTYVHDVDPGLVAVEVNRGDRLRKIEVDVPQFEARSPRRTALRPNLDGEPRREERLERREERLEDRRDNLDQRVPGKAVPSPAPAPTVVPAPAPAPTVVTPAPEVQVEVKPERTPLPRIRK